ncbi:hypothetical protein A2U01_0079433, partial [Trifolium medium]|nr:hypothetical protein [Trifolium medium]
VDPHVLGARLIPNDTKRLQGS